MEWGEGSGFQQKVGGMVGVAYSWGCQGSRYRESEEVGVLLEEPVPGGGQE